LVTESDSVIMQLVNKIVNDAFARRASDIHIEPNVEISLRSRRQVKHLKIKKPRFPEAFSIKLFLSKKLEHVSHTN